MRRRKITLIPYGGLTNRMRAIGSLIHLMQDTGTDADVIWFKDKGLNCRFDDLFQPLDIPGLSVKEADISDLILRDRPRKKNFFIPSFFENILYDSCIHEDETNRKIQQGFDFEEWVSSYSKPYLSSCTAFYRRNEKDNLFLPFRPIESLRKKIVDLSEPFSGNLYGVHIRRTDHQLCIKSCPTDAYIGWMKSAMERDSDIRFYVASDSTEEKKRLCDVFGEKIITHFHPVSRNTVKGMQEALVEMFLLSKTKKLIGSRYSMYALTAAQIGGIELVDLTIDEND